MMVARTSNDIFKRMLAYTLSRTRLSDIRESDPAVHMLASIAIEIAKSDVAAVNRQNENTIDGAEGDLLDDVLAALLPDGHERSDGYYATGGAVVFYRPMGSSGPLTIAKGMPVRRLRDGMVFYTAAAATFSGVNTASDAPVSVICGTKGTTGNCQIGEITQLGQAIAGVSSCSNTALLTNGADIEDDQAARDRAKLYIKGISPCTNNGILSRVLDYESDTYGRALFATWADYNPLTPGKAILYVDDGNGTSGPIENQVAEQASSSPLAGYYSFYTKYRPLATNPTVTWAVGTKSGYEIWSPSIGQCVLKTTNDAAPTDGIFDLSAYTTYGGLVQELQNIVNGVINDPDLPGFKGAGNQVQILPAAFFDYTPIAADILYATNSNITAVNSQLRLALTTFVNATLGIGQSLTIADVVTVLKSNSAVLNVTDVTIDGVATDRIAAPNEVIRINPDDITLS